MMSAGIAAHALSLSHGLAAAFLSIAVFYCAGLLLLPQRWWGAVRWPDSLILGFGLYAVLCWVATSSRNVPLYYVILLFTAVLWALMSLRFRRLQAMLGAPLRNTGLRRWAIEFSLLYVFAYVMASPAPGAVLTMAPEGGLDLVTYARYAQRLLAFGTADIDLSSFDFWRNPAGVYLLAWHSLPFVAEPLDAAIPALLMLTALFGVMAGDASRSAFGLSREGSLAVAALAVSAPMFRWTLAVYGLGELLAAMSVMYLAGAAIDAVMTRRVTAPLLAGITAACALLYLASPATMQRPDAIAVGIAEVARYFSPLAVFGLPSQPPMQGAPAHARAAAIVLLPFVPMFWSAAVYTIRKSAFLERVAVSPVDSALARALILYVGAAVVIGNVTVHALASPPRERWPVAWRALAQAGRMPFRSVTLKVAGEPNGVPAALAMYYMPGRKAQVIGRGPSPDELVFDSVSRQEPMFIQNFGCEGVGHADTVSARGVGCLLMAPPSMASGTSYPFNRTFLFMRFDRMTPREPGGRWNTQPTLNLTLTADPQRVGLDRDMFLNLLVDPFLAADAKPLRLIVRWGRERRGEIAVRQRQWLSLPVGSNDWSGNRVWTVPIAIDFPDRRTILFQEVALTESPRGTLAEPALP
jgi:hypothetical protein